ncbi:MAG: D-inositol-3-phosphate glycosyltransferase [Actinomycetota bacterium]|nr:D-inositol-3-phosphate glycosyltransferase [Actinomycetota bacterium]
MNVYVRELSAARARAGVACDVYTRAVDVDQPAVVNVEPGLRVHHVQAGPLAPVPKELLPGLVDEFTDAVLDRLRDGYAPDAVHANYWLSGVAGHRIKHELDLPLVSTFHTLDRVKAEVDEAESELRSAAEARVIDCSDGLLASCTEEAKQLVRLYDADPARIDIVAPGVDHAFFAPGHRGQARRALGLPENGPMLLFVGRIQPLKRADVAVRTLHELIATHPDAFLVVVGGPSGPRGDAELAGLRDLVDELGLHERVRFVPAQPHELLSTWYRAADACLVPSRSESFGLVALEAAACGTPVVAAAVGGLTTLVDHGVTGYLVDPDAQSYAGYASRVLDDDALAAEMGRLAATRARGYTWSVAAARLRRLYADLTSRQLVECP